MTDDQPLTLDAYQKLAATTALYPPDTAVTYLVMGLVGEAGEVANLGKKLMRAGQDLENLQGILPRLILNELGDVLWYTAELAGRLGYSLSEVAERNLDKLRARDERGDIKGFEHD